MINCYAGKSFAMKMYLHFEFEIDFFCVLILENKTNQMDMEMNWMLFFTEHLNYGKRKLVSLKVQFKENEKQMKNKWKTL